MERVGTLINKLKEQFDEKAECETLAITAQLLLSELQFNKNKDLTKGTVSIQMPSVHLTQVKEHIYGNALDLDPSAVSTSSNEPELVKIASGWLFEEPAEIPTLVFQPHHEAPLTQEPKIDPIKETTPINELYQLNQSPDLNAHLKEEIVEVASKLEETPIRDLRKAISVNDKYLFAHVLFRGDESMYDRSIKTINSFNIYPEAQYWIQRELKVKLSWEEGNETVKLFDQLVKRRFS
ncbi:MAG: hypothetical protein EAZ12_07545 [Sphingobacteriia bacterium]|nr:MAG: hypothetical protein EAZ12_07545 [Sphingobacteriia bacterium]